MRRRGQSSSSKYKNTRRLFLHISVITHDASVDEIKHFSAKMRPLSLRNGFSGLSDYQNQIRNMHPALDFLHSDTGMPEGMYSFYFLTFLITHVVHKKQQSRLIHFILHMIPFVQLRTGYCIFLFNVLT